MLYLEGKGVTRDLGEAFKLFERAAAQNDPWGLNNLGGMYEMGWGTPSTRPRRLSFTSRPWRPAMPRPRRISTG